MVDGVLLLVDASEGPLPQTRYVLQKALAGEAAADHRAEQNRPHRTRARPPCSTKSTICLSTWTPPKTSSIFPVLYTNAKTGVAHRQIGDSSTNLQPLFENDCCRRFRAPTGDPEAVLQMQVTNLDYSDFLGRIAIARVFQGTLRARRGSGHRQAVRHDPADARSRSCSRSADWNAMKPRKVSAGDIVAIAGVEGIQIGESITDLENPAPLEPLLIDEPTLAMLSR